MFVTVLEAVLCVFRKYMCWTWRVSVNPASAGELGCSLRKNSNTLRGRRRIIIDYKQFLLSFVNTETSSKILDGVCAE